ncbi:hypothetical protein [Nocardioides houyundeii]|uniref:hypothetical protein n=1 Tax=Nocardioides houyundeii TaxID=2045452 RepID=UPI00131522A5|nr:hypothetical protein [Nocardioides houyundeii]
MAIFVTLGIAVVGWTHSNRASRDAAKAAVAAERSATAAEQSGNAADRTADALEKMGEQWGDWMSRAEKRDQRQWSRPSSGHDLPWPSPEDGGPWNGPMPVAAPSEPAVHWTVDRLKGRLHMLRNLGRATAYDVTLTSENAVRFDSPEPQSIAMGEAVEFRAIGSMQTGTPELTVRWRETPDGAWREWKRPLP